MSELKAPHHVESPHDSAAVDQPQRDLAWHERVAFHPVLLVAFPVLALYAVNFHETTFFDAFRAVFFSAAMATILTLILSTFFPSRNRAALASALVLVMLFTYGPVYSLNPYLASWGFPILLRDRILLPIWNISMVLGIWLIYRAKINDSKVTRNLNAFSAILCGISLLSILTAACQGVGGGSQSVPAPETVKLQPPAVKRDIYYLVFDRYADQSTLQSDFGYDNQPFLDGLRARGFQVARQSRANYPKTEISMASALNMTYHGERLESIKHYRKMLKQHKVGRLLVDQGYLYYHLGTPLDGLRRNDSANVVYRFSRMPTEFSETVFKMTPFYAYLPSTDIRTQVTQKFAALAKISATPDAKFVYAHFLVPHNPWKFDRDGSLLTVAKAASRGEKENYVNQLVYTNRQMEETVDAILKNSKTPPIIVIQADEGPELRYQGDQQKTALEKVRKRVGILTAVYFPEQPEFKVSDGLSPVNTFRLVFDHYFQAGLPMLEDRTFYWEPATPLGKPDWSRPCEFVDVTEALNQMHQQEVAAKLSPPIPQS